MVSTAFKVLLKADLLLFRDIKILFGNTDGTDGGVAASEFALFLWGDRLRAPRNEGDGLLSWRICWDINEP